MLSIYFGENKKAAYGPTWFNFNYDPAWFRDPFVNEMMQGVDNSVYKGGVLIESDTLGPIPPERLSGGLKTLILIYKRPDLIFDATSCGPNCAKWLLKIGDKEDVTVKLSYIMPFDHCEPFKIRIANDGSVAANDTEYTLAALKFL